MCTLKVFLGFLFGFAFFGTQLSAESHNKFILHNLVVGDTAGNYQVEGSFIMPHVIRSEDAEYIMYFTNNGPTHTEIVRAISSDGSTWEVTGTALSGIDDSTDSDFRIGGASVIRLDDGRYRMYYRSSPEFTPPQLPKYHIRSAISDDGISFTREEGIRIANIYDDASSPFLLAAHGTFFKSKSGKYVAIFSANTLNDHGPSDLIIAISNDGLTWRKFKTLYRDCHDPVVVKVKGEYHLYAMLTNKRDIYAKSKDGINWSRHLKTLELKDQNGNSLDPTTDAGAGDFGAVSDDDNHVLFYSNFGNPSRDIAVFKEPLN